MSPTASVVITAYATPAPLLAISLDSVLGQTMDDLELVLVVDGDLADDADATVGEREAADPRLVVLRPGRVGRARALNAGLAAASAPLVAILDADDASHSRRLEVQVALLDADPDLALVGTGCHVSTSLTATADWDLDAELARSTPAAHLHPVGRALLRSNPVVHSSVLARATAPRAQGGYDEARTAQFDYDLLLRMWSAGDRLAVCDLPLVMHRRHPTQYFEGLSPGRRAWGSFRLQLSHISQLGGLSRLGYSGVAAARLAYQVGRGMAWHRASRKRLHAAAP